MSKIACDPLYRRHRFPAESAGPGAARHDHRQATIIGRGETEDHVPGVEHRSHKGLNNRAENRTSRSDDERGS